MLPEVMVAFAAPGNAIASAPKAIAKTVKKTDAQSVQFTLMRNAVMKWAILARYFNPLLRNSERDGRAATYRARPCDLNECCYTV